MIVIARCITFLPFYTGNLYVFWLLFMCRHKESSCSTFVADVASDPHLTCVKCRGQKCDVFNKCNVCVLWDQDQWQRYTRSDGKWEVRT